LPFVPQTRAGGRRGLRSGAQIPPPRPVHEATWPPPSASSSRRWHARVCRCLSRQVGLSNHPLRVAAGPRSRVARWSPCRRPRTILPLPEARSRAALSSGLGQRWLRVRRLTREMTSLKLGGGGARRRVDRARALSGRPDGPDRPRPWAVSNRGGDGVLRPAHVIGRVAQDALSLLCWLLRARGGDLGRSRRPEVGNLSREPEPAPDLSGAGGLGLGVGGLRSVSRWEKSPGAAARIEAQCWLASLASARSSAAPCSCRASMPPADSDSRAEFCARTWSSSVVARARRSLLVLRAAWRTSSASAGWLASRLSSVARWRRPATQGGLVRRGRPTS